MTINTHGLTINLKQLRKASNATSDWPVNSGGRTDIFFDQGTGDVWAKDTMDDSWTEYSDPDVIRVCGLTQRKPPQWIADRIAETVEIVRDNADWR